MLENTTSYDTEKYQELIDIIESYAIGSMLAGKNVQCSLSESTLFGKGLAIVYKARQNLITTEFVVHTPLIKNQNYTFKIYFHDSKFDPSGFKGVFKKEKYKYSLRRGQEYFEYDIEVEHYNYIERTNRLIKLFRRYL